MSAAVFCLLACADSCSCNSSDRSSGDVICGGYTEYREVSASEKDMFSDAVQAFLSTKEVCGPEGCFTPEEYRPLEKAVPVEVATQVVAGINYRFLCKTGSVSGSETEGGSEVEGGSKVEGGLKDGIGSKVEGADIVVIVFKPLPGRGEPEVTGFEYLK